MKQLRSTERFSKCWTSISVRLRQSYFRKTSTNTPPGYQDVNFISQYGVKTSRLRPKGKHPVDDFYSTAKGTAISQHCSEMNPLRAEVWRDIRLCVDHCRRVWRIKYALGKRLEIIGDDQLMADGDNRPRTPMRCYLEETSLKETHATNDVELDYLLRIKNPDNPFSGYLTEELILLCGARTNPYRHSRSPEDQCYVRGQTGPRNQCAQVRQT